MCLVFDLAERIGPDVFNCAVFIDHQGRICGKQHKMQFAEGDHPSWWFNRLGSRSRAFQTPIGRCGILICNDGCNPDIAKMLALDGARLLLIPAQGSRSKANDEAVLSRGRENGVPVIEANVGVTLVVDGGRIVALDRREEGLTLASVTIPPPVEHRAEERDALLGRFLKWRANKMRRRYEKTIERLHRKRWRPARHKGP